MKKRKSKRLAFLLILSPLTLGGISSCQTQQTIVVTEKSSEIKVKEGISNGKVTTSLTGTIEVGTEIEIIAIPNEGYEVDKYYLNDQILTGNTFKTVEGDNVVSATFKASPIKVEYGSVQIISDKVKDGTVVATLEDGTLIDGTNRRLEVGTKVLLKFEGLNECYEIKEAKLNETTLEIKDGKCEFSVIKGKNFISADFGLINPGKGLIRLDGEVSNAKVEISNLNNYVDVNCDVTIKITPEANYTVKTVSVNGKEIKESETENTFIFKASEGLNTVSVVVTSVATSISIIIPEDWVLDDRVTQERYYAQVGDVFKLDAKFEPEGAFDNLIWSLAYDSDAEYIEVKDDGSIKVLKEYNGGITVKVALKSNPEASDTISLVPVSSAEFGVAKLRSDFKRDKTAELEKGKKSSVVIETKKSSDTKSSKTTYDFESFKEGHSVTKVTDDKGMSTFFYRTNFNDTFYAIHRDATGDKAVEKATKVTPENKEELETRLKVFGGVEFVESQANRTYSGALDFVYETIFGDYSLFDEDDKDERNKIFDGTTVVYSEDGYRLSTNYTYSNFLGVFNSDIKLDIGYNMFYDRIDTLTYERKDYELGSENDVVNETTPYDLNKITVDMTYGDKESDTNNIFDINDYLLEDFMPIIYTDKNKISETTLKPNASGKLELTVGNTYYIDIDKLVPETALDDFNELEVECDNKKVVGYFSSTSNKAKYYFEPSGEGEAKITFKIGTITKTLEITSSFVPIQSVIFDEKVKERAFVNEKIELKASVTPDKGVSSDEVTFRIKEGSNSCEASIIEEAGSWSTSFYLTALKAGSVTVIATSVGDSTKSVEKKFTFKETPNVLSSLGNKKYNAKWSEFDMSTYGTIEYSYEIDFGVEGKSATIKFSSSSEDYYTGEMIKTSGEYEASVTQNGTSLVFSDYKDLGSSTIGTEGLPALNLSINDEGILEKLTLSLNGETRELNESIDIIPSLKGRTFQDTYGNYVLSFVEENGVVTCNITCSDYGGTYKFSANIEQSGNQIKLIDIVPLTEGADSSVLPSTTFTCKVSSGKVTSLTYSNEWFDEELTEKL